MSSSIQDQNAKNIEKLFDQMQELQVGMAEIKIIVSEGFKSTHNRQDITNGRIAKTENRVADLEKTDSRMEDRVGELLKAEEKEQRHQAESSTRWLNLLYSIIEKAIWIALGALLFYGRSIFNTFF